MGDLNNTTLYIALVHCGSFDTIGEVYNPVLREGSDSLLVMNNYGVSLA